MNPSSRLKRLFAADGKCFDVAIDHGFFNEYTFLGGIEDMCRRAIHNCRFGSIGVGGENNGRISIPR